MDHQKRFAKIVVLLVFASMISMACLGLFSKYEKGPQVYADYFSFAEPRLKDNPRFYDVDEYGDFVTIYEDDDEIYISLYIDYGETSDTERQLGYLLEDIDIRNHDNFKKVKVGGYPGLSVTFADEVDDEAVAGKIILVNLEDATDDKVYLFIFGVASLEDDEMEETKEIFDNEIDPMLDIIVDTLELFNLFDF